MSWLSSFFVANSISEAGVPVEIPMSSYCKELVRWKPSGFGCIFLIFTSENGELSIEKTLWMELATLHAYLSCTFAWLSHFDRSEHLHGFLSILSKYSLPFGLLVLFVFRFSFTSQRSFVCTFEIVCPKSYGRSKIGGFRIAKEPIRSGDFIESGSSHIIDIIKRAWAKRRYPRGHT